MKSNNIIGAIFAAVLTLTANAQTPIAPSLPVFSPDALREYALPKVASGSRSVYANTMDYGYTNRLTYTNITANGAEAVLDKLFAVEFRYRLVNTNDQINGNVWLNDSAGHPLFNGWASYTPASLVTDGKPVYHLGMEEIPLFTNVESAEVLALDEDGITARRYDQRVDRDGTGYFAPWLAGAPNGLLAVRFKDGRLVTYQLAGNGTGSVIGRTLEVQSSWNLPGHYVYPLADAPTTPTRTVTIVAVKDRPTVLIELRRNQWNSFDVTGLVQKDGKVTFERPTAALLSTEDGQLENRSILPIPYVPGQDYGVVSSVASIKRLRWEWANFGKPGLLYTGPQNGGGKGGGGEVTGTAPVAVATP